MEIRSRQLDYSSFVRGVSHALQLRDWKEADYAYGKVGQRGKRVRIYPPNYIVRRLLVLFMNSRVHNKSVCYNLDCVSCIGTLAEGSPK